MLAQQGFFGCAQIGQSKFSVNHFNVRNRVNFTRDMNHVVIVKTTHHVCNRIGFANIGEELIAQTFAFGRTCDQTRNINKLNCGKLHALGFDNFSQRIHARIRHFDHADIRLDGAKWVVLRRNACFGQGVKKSGFANIGQTNDAAA